MASQNIFNDFIVTSPNTDYVPEYPVERQVIHTYTDGRWGVHEYSRWPQPHIDGMMHVACIPRRAKPPGTMPVLWETLLPSTHWEEDASIAVSGIGYVKKETRTNLEEAAVAAINQYKKIREIPEVVRRYGSFLVMLLQQVLDRMKNLPCGPLRAIAVAAHAQRLSLELVGLKTYLQVVLPRLETTLDFSDQVLDVVGGFLRDGADVQTWWRIGLPFWFLQPMRGNLAVWRVVDHERPSYLLSDTSCHPPILHAPKVWVGVTNLTGNWLSSMVMSVSKNVSGSHLASLSLVAMPKLPEGPESKRVRMEEGEVSARHLSMRAGELPEPGANDGKKRTRRGKKRRAREELDLSVPQLADGSVGACSPVALLPHPSRNFVPPAFYDIGHVWETALRAVPPVPRTVHSALYFYPPPFLLDTVEPGMEIPSYCLHPENARTDTKVTRYMHNLVRIREFCRARLFDVTLTDRPLTIAEWRVALFGDYLPKPTGHPSAPNNSQHRRALRRQGERNEIGALFHKVAHMDCYEAELVTRFRDIDVDAEEALKNPVVRAQLIWEAHEVNYRAELLALDALIVQSSEWREIHKWEREQLISQVWGDAASCVSALPSGDIETTPFCWVPPHSAGWQSCRTYLRAFAHILTRWPGCPEQVIQLGKCELQRPSEYEKLQASAVEFYVRTFIHKYSRLPIPPIPFPSVA